MLVLVYLDNSIYMWQNASITMERCEFVKVFRAVFGRESNTVIVKSCGKRACIYKYTRLKKKHSKENKVEDKS